MYCFTFKLPTIVTSLAIDKLPLNEASPPTVNNFETPIFPLIDASPRTNNLLFIETSPPVISRRPEIAVEPETSKSFKGTALLIPTFPSVYTTAVVKLPLLDTSKPPFVFTLRDAFTPTVSVKKIVFVFTYMDLKGASAEPRL